MRKSSEILRLAAKALEEDRYAENGSCWTVKCLLLDLGVPYIMATDAAYQWHLSWSPMRWMSQAFGFGMEEDCWGFALPSEDNGPRILGLCLAAAIAESEGD